MIFKKGRYSGFLRPISYAIDLAVIHIFAYLFLGGGTEFLNYTIFVTIAWIVSSSIINFYEIYRYTKAIKILSLVVKQTMMFMLIVSAVQGIGILKIGGAKRGTQSATRRSRRAVMTHEKRRITSQKHQRGNRFGRST